MQIKSGPTKRFFIEMLTRDIDLDDAILDLLDNCMDGVVRSQQNSDNNRYDGFISEITISPDEFVIKDNCGGISENRAINNAFMMGKPVEADEHLPTVGLYGIGMKRAIFKMGKSSTVQSQHDGKSFEISITPEWIASEDNWALELVEKETELESDGVRIQILELKDEIKDRFDAEKSSFIAELKEKIRTHFSYIMEKGFTVIVNGEQLEPKSMAFKWAFDEAGNPLIHPYMYTGELEGVSVELVLGFYQAPVSDEEENKELEVKRVKENAGWTVVCNDRVVVYADKTHITGWGETSIPNYHSQFIAIAGIVKLKSDNASKLPITTTKRGLDTSSRVYSRLKDIMKDAMKIFIRHTNKWKGRKEEQLKIFKNSKTVDFKESLQSTSTFALKENNSRKYHGKVVLPDLPSPETDKQYRVIHFTQSISNIKKVGVYLVGDEYDDKTPSDIGALCFDYVFDEATQG